MSHMGAMAMGPPTKTPKQREKREAKRSEARVKRDKAAAFAFDVCAWRVVFFSQCGL